MTDEQLQLIGVDDNSENLILASESGSNYRLRIDDALRVATSAPTPRASSDGSEDNLENFTPRDIQARIRAGATAEQIAAISKLPLDHVQRYEGPALAERSHIANESRGILSTIAAPGNPEFLDEKAVEKAFDRKLADNGVDPTTANWDAWRQNDGSWLVIMSFDLTTETPDQKSQDARWKYTPSNKTLNPQNSWAKRIHSTAGDNRQANPHELVENTPKNHDKSSDIFDFNSFDDNEESINTSFDSPETQQSTPTSSSSRPYTPETAAGPVTFNDSLSPEIISAGQSAQNFTDAQKNTHNDSDQNTSHGQVNETTADNQSQGAGHTSNQQPSKTNRATSQAYSLLDKLRSRRGQRIGVSAEEEDEIALILEQTAQNRGIYDEDADFDPDQNSLSDINSQSNALYGIEGDQNSTADPVSTQASHDIAPQDQNATTEKSDNTQQENSDDQDHGVSRRFFPGRFNTQDRNQERPNKPSRQPLRNSVIPSMEPSNSIDDSQEIRRNLESMPANNRSVPGQNSQNDVSGFNDNTTQLPDQTGIYETDSMHFPDENQGDLFEETPLTENAFDTLPESVPREDYIQGYFGAHNKQNLADSTSDHHSPDNSVQKPETHTSTSDDAGSQSASSQQTDSSDTQAQTGQSNDPFYSIPQAQSQNNDTDASIRTDDMSGHSDDEQALPSRRQRNNLRRESEDNTSDSSPQPQTGQQNVTAPQFNSEEGFTGQNQQIPVEVDYVETDNISYLPLSSAESFDTGTIPTPMSATSDPTLPGPSSGLKPHNDDQGQGVDLVDSPVTGQNPQPEFPAEQGQQTSTPQNIQNNPQNMPAGHNFAPQTGQQQFMDPRGFNNGLDSSGQNQNLPMTSDSIDSEHNSDFEDPETTPKRLSDENKKSRQRRSSVPSWDEIVFGTKNDKDK